MRGHHFLVPFRKCTFALGNGTNSHTSNSFSVSTGFSDAPPYLHFTTMLVCADNVASFLSLTLSVSVPFSFAACTTTTS